MTEIRERKLEKYGSIAGWEGYSHHLPDGLLLMGKVSYAEFLEWADEDTLAEWVNGEIIMTSPASFRHQMLRDFLLKVLSEFAEAYDLGTIISSPFQMKLPDSGPGREPDLLFVAKAHEQRLQATFLDGPADLVIEVVSPESQERDRETKFAEYAAGNVPEYWLIDPTRNQAEFYELDPNGQYQLVPPDSTGKYYSRALPGFWLKVEWLWRENLPGVQSILKVVGGATYAAYLVRQSQEEAGL